MPLDQRTFDTPYGPVPLWGEAAAFSGARPVVVAIAGAFAIARGPLFHLAPHLADADVVAGHLPGNHAPTLISASIGIYAAAYSHAIAAAFPDRPVILCGASVGGLVALAVRAPQVRRSVVIEPPLVMSKLWPMRTFLRRKLAEAPDDAALRSFVVNVFGVTESDVQERRYDGALAALSTPTHVLCGGQPLFPERAVSKLPSLVDEPERGLMAAHPMIRLSVLEGAGHNVLQEATAGFLAALRGAIAEAAP